MMNIYEATTNLSKLVDRAAAGEDVVIARNGRPLARLVRYARSAKRRRLGRLAGRVRMAGDFDAPLPKELFGDFKGNP